MSSPATPVSTSNLPAPARFIVGSSGLNALEIKSPLVDALIYVQGAHVTHWQPAGAQPVLFVSQQSNFVPGKAIRGGVPICFPWFANRAGHPESPAHGFVRATDWSLDSVSENSDGSLSALFTFVDSKASRSHWPHPFRAIYRVTVGSMLEMALDIENTGATPFTFEAALHSYFTVADVKNVEITGLEDAEYIDKVEGFVRKRLGRDPLRFTGETDRVFVNTASTTRMIDPGFNRTIVVEKGGSNTTVVWNPWLAKAKAMTDFGDDEWPGMACIETANSGENAVTLPPGQRHAMVARIRLE